VPVQTISWRDDQLFIIDQTLLPVEYREIRLSTVEQTWEAIRSLRVRGAPAIGVCAAFGVVVGLDEARPSTAESAKSAASKAADRLATARPTAVNLFWALDRMRARLAKLNGAESAASVRAALAEEAVTIFDEDRRICRKIGESGASLVPDGGGVLTHCNAGGLATADYGTALAVLFRAQEDGKKFHVFADETRPLLQGARLTAGELHQAGIDVTVICDNMAAQVMREGRIQMVVVGADRIAANGDAANKIGTYSVAVLAKAHNIPFYVAAPASTFDLSIASGAEIPIEQRSRDEIAAGFGRVTVPDGVQVYNPAFDVTPAELIAGIITEHGVLRPPLRESIAAKLRGAS
jgi:methylthioribose-1-phosphate isomerase